VPVPSETRSFLPSSYSPFTVLSPSSGTLFNERALLDQEEHFEMNGLIITITATVAAIVGVGPVLVGMFHAHERTVGRKR
jgi:hypothetical protein